MSIELDLVWAYEGRPGRLEGEFESKGYLNAWYLVRGGVQVRGAGESLAVEAPAWVWLPSDRHWHRFTDDAQLLSINFVARWPGGRPLFDIHLLRVSPGDRYLRMLRLGRMLAGLAQSAGVDRVGLQHLHFVQCSLPYYLRLRRLFEAWFEQYCQALDDLGIEQNRHTPADSRVHHAVTLVQNWDWSQPLLVSDLAARVHLSPKHLTRLFSQDLGVPLREHINQRRLEHAQRLLLGTRLPIKRVAYQLGFSDPANFSNWFREHAGVSCTDFRKHTYS